MFLKTKEKIATKTKCIIRNNKNNIKPKIYEIKIEMKDIFINIILRKEMK